MNNVKIFFKKLDEKAVVPSYAHDGDVGMDMTAIGVEYDAENDTYIYHTGLAFESAKGYGAFLFPRSSNRKTDAYLCNHVGVGDIALYRGEIMFCFKNRTSLKDRASLEAFNFFIHNRDAHEDAINMVYASVMGNPMDYAPYKVGDRVGQMIVMPHPYVNLFEVDKLSDTDRGEGGFGSTGN